METIPENQELVRSQCKYRYSQTSTTSEVVIHRNMTVTGEQSIVVCNDKKEIHALRDPASDDTRESRQKPHDILGEKVRNLMVIHCNRLQKLEKQRDEAIQMVDEMKRKMKSMHREHNGDNEHRTMVSDSVEPGKHYTLDAIRQSKKAEKPREIKIGSTGEQSDHCSVAGPCNLQLEQESLESKKDFEDDNQNTKVDATRKLTAIQHEHEALEKKMEWVIAIYQDRIHKMEQQRDEAKLKSEKHHSGVVQQQRTSTLMANEMERLRTELSDAQSANTKYQKIMAESMQIQCDLKKEVSGQQDVILERDQLKEELKVAQESAKEMQDQWIAAQDEYKELKKIFVSDRRSKTTLQFKLEELRSINKQLQSNCEDRENALISNSGKYEKLKKEHDEVIRKFTSHRRETARLIESKDAAIAHAKEASEIENDPAFTELKAKLIAVELERDDSRRDYQTKVPVLTAQRDAARQQLSQMQRKMDQWRSTNQQLRKDLVIERKFFDQKFQNVRDELTVMKDMHHVYRQFLL